MEDVIMIIQNTKRSVILAMMLAVGFTSYTASNAAANQTVVSTCAFCQILDKKAPAVIIYEDNDVLVLEKRPVRRPVDCLIIPKKHIVNIKDLKISDSYDKDIVSKMMFVAQELSKRLDGKGDFTITMNNGAESSQSVFHMHAHFRSPNNWKKS